MSTRATIRFVDEFGWEVFVYRGSDGRPDVILPDLNAVLESAEGKWSGSELGLLISLFFGRTFRRDARVQEYMLAEGWAGDESYRYLVTWDSVKRRWTASGEI